jgi:hypothetical protein
MACSRLRSRCSCSTSRIALLVAALWRSVRAAVNLLRPEVSEEEINAILHVTSPNIGFYVGVVVLAIVAPHVAGFGYRLIAPVLVPRARGGEGPTATAAGSA